jgi:hypothetical protein
MSYDIIVNGGQNEYCGTIREFIEFGKGSSLRPMGETQKFVFSVTSDRDHTDPDLDKFFHRCETVTLIPEESPGRFRRWRIRTDEVTDDQIEEYRTTGIIAVDELTFLNMTEAIDTKERFALPGVVPSDRRPDHAGPPHKNLNITMRLKARHTPDQASGQNIHQGRRP